MTGKNKIDALFSYQKPDRVPIGSLWMSIGFNTVGTGGTVAEAYNDPDIGNIDPTILLDESSNQIFERSRIALEKGKRAPGGFVLGPGCDIPLMTPSQNLHAMTKAVEDHG